MTESFPEEVIKASFLEQRGFDQKVIDAVCEATTLEPYEKAQMLDCGKGTKYGSHSLNLQTCIARFGGMQKNGQCATPKPCPLCRGIVTQYVPNPALQDLVNALLGLNQGDAHYKKMCAIIKNMQAAKLSKEAWYYPLPSSLFTCNLFDTSDKCFFLRFKNTSKNQNCIETLVFNVEKDLEKASSYYIYLFFYSYENKDQMKEQLSKHAMHIEDRSHCVPSDRDFPCFVAYFENVEELLECVHFLIKHNKFDKEAQEKLVIGLEKLKTM